MVPALLPGPKRTASCSRCAAPTAAPVLASKRFHIASATAWEQQWATRQNSRHWDVHGAKQKPPRLQLQSDRLRLTSATRRRLRESPACSRQPWPSIRKCCLLLPDARSHTHNLQIPQLPCAFCKNQRSGQVITLCERASAPWDSAASMCMSSYKMSTPREGLA